MLESMDGWSLNLWIFIHHFWNIKGSKLQPITNQIWQLQESFCLHLFVASIVLFKVFFLNRPRPILDTRAQRQQTMRFCGKIAIASFRTLEFAKFKAELRIRLVAKRGGCSEEVLILLTIFEELLA